jgi:hypothetical protein
MSEASCSTLKVLVGRKLSTYQIADELGISQTTVRYWLKKYGIKSAGKKPKRVRFCLYCGEQLINNRCMYCSNVCHYEQQYKLYIDKWLSGETNGGGKGDQVSNYIRKYLIRRCNGKCAVCGIDKWNGEDILLVMDHINGNPMDNSCGNLRMVCSNCDAQLPTYKSKNKGNGRYSRRERCKEGKSY